VKVSSKEVVESVLVWFSGINLGIDCVHNVEFVPLLITLRREHAESERKRKRVARNRRVVRSTLKHV